MNLLAKKWIKRMRVINGYLPGMADGAEKFTDSELIRYCIKPNIPPSWLKDFKIGGGLVMNSTFQVIQLLQVIEENEKFTRKKSKNDEKPGKRNGKRDKKKEDKDKRQFKNKCRLHPDGNHEWEDCFQNPKSKNYKGNKSKNKNEGNKNNHIHIK